MAGWPSGLQDTPVSPHDTSSPSQLGADYRVGVWPRPRQEAGQGLLLVQLVSRRKAYKSIPGKMPPQLPCWSLTELVASPLMHRATQPGSQ